MSVTPAHIPTQAWPARFDVVGGARFRDTPHHHNLIAFIPRYRELLRSGTSCPSARQVKREDGVGFQGGQCQCVGRQPPVAAHKNQKFDPFQGSLPSPFPALPYHPDRVPSMLMQPALCFIWVLVLGPQ